MSYIEFKDVKKIYKTGDVEVHALDGTDFSIEKGELCVILGQSGAGKTTLLNILGGMDTLTSGTVLLDGQKRNLRTTDVPMSDLFSSFIT